MSTCLLILDSLLASLTGQRWVERAFRSRLWTFLLNTVLLLLGHLPPLQQCIWVPSARIARWVDVKEARRVIAMGWIGESSSGLSTDQSVKARRELAII